MDSYQDPKPGVTYISRSLTSFDDPSRNIRIATKSIEHSETFAFAKMRGELVLRHAAGAQTRIDAKFFEDDRQVCVLNIQGYTAATMKPRNASFSFRGDEIDSLVEFINQIQAVRFDHEGGKRATDQELRRLILSAPQARALTKANQDVIAAAVRAELTAEDVVAVAYRKKQLGVFERLLSDPAYFEQLRERKQCTREGLWQQFFEKNPWIFGYGLSYIYVTGLDGQKLEQVVSGHMAFKHGKRSDGLLRSRGAISSLCFVEIKTHDTTLLASKPYREGCWGPSKELAGAVAQVQGTVALAVADIREKLTGRTEDGHPTGEEAYNHSPRSFLVVGNLQDFVGEHGVNVEQHRSFELFRGNTLNPEIITFDELLERAKFIVHQHESSSAGRGHRDDEEPKGIARE